MSFADDAWNAFQTYSGTGNTNRAWSNPVFTIEAHRTSPLEIVRSARQVSKTTRAHGCGNFILQNGADACQSDGATERIQQYDLWRIDAGRTHSVVTASDLISAELRIAGRTWAGCLSSNRRVRAVHSR